VLSLLQEFITAGSEERYDKAPDLTQEHSFTQRHCSHIYLQTVSLWKTEHDYLKERNRTGLRRWSGVPLFWLDLVCSHIASRKRKCVTWTLIRSHME